jgi:uncharacterized membrane protein
MKKKDRSELVAGFIEGMVTTSVLLTLAMLTFGVELFIALIPIIIVLSIAALSIVVFLGFIFCGRVVDDIESTYKKSANKRDISVKGGRGSEWVGEEC